VNGMSGTNGGGEGRVTIIGGGAAGVLTAVHLLNHAGRRGLPLEIQLVDPAEQLGRGVAYATPDPRHLLNVPAGRMSADADDPDHFVRWLGERGIASAAAGDYVPRGWYGTYLASCLDLAMVRNPGVRLVRVRERAVSARSDGVVWHIALASGRVVESDAAVLALGNFPARDDFLPEAVRRSDRFVADPWLPGALVTVPAHEDVLLIGTGLTMTDVALALERPGRIVHAVSRTGLLPQPHSATPAGPVAVPQMPACDRLPELRRAILAHVSRCRRLHGDWRPAIDGLRAQTSVLWQRLTPAERRRFVEDDLRIWETHRHRMPPETAEALAGAERAGRLRTGSGVIADASRLSPWSIRVRFEDGGTLDVGAVVNCTGASGDPAGADDPLVAALLDRGFARPGPLGLGFATTAAGRLVPRSGAVAAPMWAIGSLRRGDLWETTAIPEIRTQARTIAESVVSGHDAGGYGLTVQAGASGGSPERRRYRERDQAVLAASSTLR
jgi:uncharacterized NAD(P)/FAD-binding protein YdhS